MKIDVNTVSKYLENLHEERKGYFMELLETIRQNIPEGFKEQLSYGMIGFVVPHKKHPNGYHANPELPLPFVNLAMQKNAISLYHMGIYARNDTGLVRKRVSKICKIQTGYGQKLYLV
jgi:hypothetical protein